MALSLDQKESPGNARRKGWPHIKTTMKHSGGVHLSVRTIGKSSRDAGQDPEPEESMATSLPPLPSPRTGTLPPFGNLSEDQKTNRRGPMPLNHWCGPSEYWYITKKTRVPTRRAESPRGKCVARNLESTLYWNKGEGDGPVSANGNNMQVSGPLAALAGL